MQCLHAAGHKMEVELRTMAMIHNALMLLLSL
jgi:hypothetical protein